MSKELKIYLVWLLLIVGTQLKEASAQGVYTDIDVMEWPVGYVITASGDSVTGAVAYYFRKEIVKVIGKDGDINSFTPVNVQRFIVKNTYTGQEQLFKTVYWNQENTGSDFKKPSFFEELNEGEITLMKKETLLLKNTNSTSDFNRELTDYERNLEAHRYSLAHVMSYYYVLTSKGEVKKIKRVRKDLLDLFGNRAEKIKRYAREHRLRFENPGEVTAIVNYYNKLSSSDPES